MRSITDHLQQWVEVEGRCRIGQICLLKSEDGWDLRHEEDTDCANETLKTYWDEMDAMELARWDENHEYRPLKSAPNLARGWRLIPADWSQIRAALDRFYPAALANYRAWRCGQLRAVTLRETVSRQTGMYRITGKLTVEQADDLVGCACEPEKHCLRRILWELEDGKAITTLGEAKAMPPGPRDLALPLEIPILCVEMCNLLVAAGRKYIKSLPQE